MRLTFIFFLATFLFLSNGCRAQYTPVKVDVSSEITVNNGVEFYVHKIEKRQTLFSIARAYNVTPDIIIKDNPGLEKGLKEGARILIRKAGKVIAGDTVPSVRIQAEHTVRWYENLSSIAKKYGVTEEEIAIVNSLKAGKTETRQVLKIPYPGEAFKNPATDNSGKSINKENITDSEQRNSDQDRQKKRFSDNRRSEYAVSLIIPLGGKDTADTENISGSFVEFYQGFLIAMEDLKREFSGINLQLNVFDSDKVSPAQIVARGELEKSDMIIGPVYADQIESVLLYAYEKDISLVSPVDPSGDRLTEQYSNFFHVGTPVTYQQKALIENISPYQNILVIYEDGGQDGQFVEITKEMLESRGLTYKTLSYDILKGRSILPQFEERLNVDSLNQIVVASNSEAFVSDVLRNLNLLQSRGGFRMKLFGAPRWRNFDNVDINLYHGMGLNISLQYYVDYNGENVKRFISRFRELYNSEPTAYSFQAYDVAYFFLGALFNYGPEFSEHIAEYNRKLLQSDYRFVRRNGDKGFVNTGVRVIKYRPDYSTDTGSSGF